MIDNMQSDEYASIFESKEEALQYNKMIDYINTLYFDLSDLMIIEGMEFDESWIDDLEVVADASDDVKTIIARLKTRDFASALFYARQILDNDQYMSEEEIKNSRTVELDAETIGNL